jgi:hypothetical protein
MHRGGTANSILQTYGAGKKNTNFALSSHAKKAWVGST